MSSLIFRCGLNVVDDFRYRPPFDGAEVSFIMRGYDETDAIRKLKLTLRDVPQDMEMVIHHFGFKPDYPVPVARYFIEARIRNPEHLDFGGLWWWHGGWQGRKGRKGKRYD